MALDRDELAARCYLTILTPFEGCAPVEDWDYEVLSDTATKAADALLSRLAPAPSPAASPAPYVPKVGDVVGIDNGKDYGETRVVTKIDGGDLSYVRLRASGEEICRHTMEVWKFTYLRPATASERAAAGLPVDEAKESATKPVDREGLARAIYEAVRAGNMLMGAKKWDELGDLTKRDSFNAADAAIAFMAKGPAFDRAEFNEAQEREAAKVAVSRDAGDDFTRGWLARARVAAKRGAS